MPPSTTYERSSARIDRAFLPAALEIVETPASPSVRLTAFLICLMLLVATIWSWLGWVDLIAVAPGKVMPAGRTKEIQAFETGVVRKILVDDGDSVHAGQPLVALDPTLALADRDRFEEQLMRAQLDAARLNALLGGNGATADSDPFVGIQASDAAIREARGRLAADRAGRQAKLATAELEIAGKRAEKASQEAEIVKADATLAIAIERTNIRLTSFERQLTSRVEYLNAVQQRVELENEKKVIQEKVQVTNAAIQAATTERARILAETERDWRADLQKALHDQSEAQSELVKAQKRAGLTSVTAPVDGVVQDIAVHTEGGVVQPGQMLLRVVPSDGQVVIESVIENKDVGFVKSGQDVEVKVEAYPFTRYGFIHGHVATIARDSAPDPELQQRPHAPQNALGSEPNELRRSGGLVYVARISVDDPTLNVDGIRMPLEPGMAITAEIKTGKRRILDYVLSPVAQRVHDALHER